VDIDGDDEIVFGGAQFTENDVLHLPNEPPIETAEDGVGIRDAAVDGKFLKQNSPQDIHSSGAEITSSLESIDNAISAARKMGDTTSLIKAFESKVKQLVSLCGLPNPPHKSYSLLIRNHYERPLWPAVSA
jgi:hypothetical protein